LKKEKYAVELRISDIGEDSWSISTTIYCSCF